ncbi:MAG: hypothetical protein BGO45_10535 [Microbacterium sp. 71-36]|uniref:hypothetical protein n=1 Tax=unclassified Microbacterium TaxID=2609290 RepID=UPI00086D0019|nr:MULTISPECIES: hypothetical protein [unclassified Microbacterium]MBN9210702.1 hypothetical protein [Microbacterium sp.]ODT37070.1 MAG: hypothetical protein ABS60_14135 [Microbacterium sp. SCN 71-17]OJV77228.1 MAG: hypothetical protein BGO45_10535 [Microbacterium sp. 71-36]
MSRIQYIEAGAATISAGDLALMEKLVVPGIPGLTATPAALYGFSYLSPTYTGPLFRMRRSSDNTELDCYTVGQGLAFAGSGSGLLRTAYDQTGNGRHFQQPTAAAQFALVQGGVQVTINGRQAAAMDNVDDYMSAVAPGAFAAGAASFFAVVEATASSTSGRAVFHEARGGGSARYVPAQHITGGSVSQLGRDNAAASYLPVGTTAEAPAAFVSGTPRLLTFIDTGSVVRKRVNRTSLADVAYTRSGTSTIDTLLLNGQISGGNVSQFWGGKWAELIVFTSAVSNADRDAVENSRVSYYPALATA